MNRRDALFAGAAAGASVLLAEGARAGDHKGHSMKPVPNGEFRTAAEACLKDGHACLEHCIELLSGGDTSLGECASIVKQMLAVCSAVGPVASANSKHTKTLARLCHDVCADCKKACDEHKEHATCRACAESCAAILKVTKKMIE